jgi:cobalt-precorrin 5A hydrolase
MIVAGFGFREAAEVESLRDALGQAMTEEQLTHLSVPEDKAAANSILALAAQLDIPVLAVSNATMAAIDTPTQSSVILEKRGIGSVAEAVALAAVGDGAQLQGPRSISSDRLATCAIAIGGSS